MRIPDVVLNTVAFLCVPNTSGSGEDWKYGGSGFFVVVRNETDPNMGNVYFVTARHCVTQAAKSGHLHIRLNRRDGSAEPLSVDHDWIYPDDHAVDLAILPGAPSRDVFAYQFLSPELFVTPERVSEHGIGPGDELFIVGLFTQRHGKQRNLPIVRSGIVAAMPDEPLFDEGTGLTFQSCIAEVRSIGGLSGSPVFVALEPGRVDPRSNNIVLKRLVYLLGVVRGHWDYKTKRTALAFSNDELTAVNMGMALVTPIDELSKLLFSERLVKMRREEAIQRTKENAPTKDGAFVTTAISSELQGSSDEKSDGVRSNAVQTSIE